MQNIKFKKVAVLVSLSILQPMLNPGSLAFAKKRTPPKAFSFIMEGGKASQGECDGERKIPRKLKHLKEFAKTGSYMGSELQDPEPKGKTDEPMWKHFFRVKASCNSALAKTPSAVETAAQEKTRAELPPDDADDESDQPNQPEQPEGPDSE